jgi:FkbM family methyltransferase
MSFGKNFVNDRTKTEVFQSMKNVLKSIFLGTGFYEHLKYSKVFALYEKLFKPGVKLQFDRELAFYRSFLKASELFFDVGANDGHKTEVFLKLAKKVLCVEPEPGNVQTLRTRFRNRKSRVFIEDIVVSDTSGTKTLFVHHKGSAFNTLSEKFKTVGQQQGEELFREAITYSGEITVQSKTLDQLIAQYGKPSFIKVDTEGYEKTVLGGLTQPIAFMSLEFMLPQFAPELYDSIQYMERTFGDQLVYNLARDERLLLPRFVNRNELQSHLDQCSQCVIELIVHNRGC